MQKICQDMSLSQTVLAHRLCLVREAEDQNLARAVNTKTLAEPGSNYLCSSSQGELFRRALATPTTYGGFGDTLEAHFSKHLTGCLSFVPVLKQSVFCLQDAHFLAFYLNLIISLKLSRGTTHVKPEMHTRYMLFQAQRHCRTIVFQRFVCRCWFYTMQSRRAGYFYSPSTSSHPFLPLTFVTKLWQGPLSQSTAISVHIHCGLTSAIWQYSRERERQNKQECWNHTGSWKQLKWFPTSTATETFYRGTSTMKTKMPQLNVCLWGKKRGTESYCFPLKSKLDLTHNTWGHRT